jgi:hypothetical protein
MNQIKDGLYFCYADGDKGNGLELFTSDVKVLECFRKIFRSYKSLLLDESDPFDVLHRKACSFNYFIQGGSQNLYLEELDEQVWIFIEFWSSSDKVIDLYFEILAFLNKELSLSWESKDSIDVNRFFSQK